VSRIGGLYKENKSTREGKNINISKIPKLKRFLAA
jgi:hypothetical protein